MPGRSQASAPHIDKLDYTRPQHTETSARQVSLTGSLFERAAVRVAERDDKKRNKQLVRYASLLWAVVICLCAGSLTTYSLYSPILHRRLGYSQYKVSGIIVAAEIALYLPVPLSGYLCDRYGPARPTVIAGLLSGLGYLTAAFTYRSRLAAHAHWQYGMLVLGLSLAGVATSCLYLCSLTCCVKNFGRGRHQGLALALPIAAFGLSGMCLSQFGARVLYESSPDRPMRRGDVDVFRYFCFLAVILLVSGLIGGLLLQVVDEDKLIEEAAESLERSGLLERDVFADSDGAGYGTIDESAASLCKKTRVLSEETRLFLSDPAMWLLLLGFFLVTGPGECFMNNVGTMIGTLHPPSTDDSEMTTSPATHVSVIAIGSTIARLASGSLSDVFGPSTSNPDSRRGVSRVIFLIASALLMVAGQMIFATGFAQNHGERFWIVSALIGAGYGAVFSLTPMLISIVWGVENFGTNWGIVAVVPAFGATFWGLVYSAVYQSHISWGQNECHGVGCYASTFWAMAASTIVACGIWAYAWRGPNGWHGKGIRL